MAKQDELPMDNYWNVLFDELNELENERINMVEKSIRPRKKMLTKVYNHY